MNGSLKKEFVNIQSGSSSSSASEFLAVAEHFQCLLSLTRCLPCMVSSEGRQSHCHQDWQYEQSPRQRPGQMSKCLSALGLLTTRVEGLVKHFTGQAHLHRNGLINCSAHNCVFVSLVAECVQNPLPVSISPAR